MSKSVGKETELDLLREAAKISTEILAELKDAVHIGVTPVDINDLTWALCKQKGVEPAFFGVNQGLAKHFGGALCISVNNVILHGLPTKIPFADGDLIKLDFGIKYKGVYTDQCVTVGLGKLSDGDRHLISVGKLAIESSIKQAVTGNHVGDIGNVIETIAASAGFSVLTEYVGHGIGRTLWESPQVPAYGNPGSGAELKAGKCICIEAQIVAGDNEVYVDDDGWSILTEDGSKGVMFEYMVIVGDSPEIITSTQNWPIFIEK